MKRKIRYKKSKSMIAKLVKLSQQADYLKGKCHACWTPDDKLAFVIAEGAKQTLKYHL